MFEKEQTKNKALQIQIEVCEFLNDSKNYEIFFAKTEEIINGVISTNLCIWNRDKKIQP